MFCVSLKSFLNICTPIDNRQANMQQNPKKQSDKEFKSGV